MLRRINWGRAFVGAAQGFCFAMGVYLIALGDYFGIFNLCVPLVLGFICWYWIPRRRFDRLLTPRPVDNAAQKRARKMLLDNLNPEQRKQLQKHNWIELRSNKGNLWRLDCGRYISNAYLYTKTGFVYTYCIHMKTFVVNRKTPLEPAQIGPFPIEDHILTQALTLRTDEDRFLEIAYVVGSSYDDREVPRDHAQALPGTTDPGGTEVL